MEFHGKIGVITGGTSGIGRATALAMAKEGIERVAIVDMSDTTREFVDASNSEFGREVFIPYVGDVTDEGFRRSVFGEMNERFGCVHICVPAAGILRDRLAVKVDNSNCNPKPDIYPIEDFQRVIDVNLVAAIYWALETVGSIATYRARKELKRWDPAEGMQGAVIFIGSVSSAGNQGQISYATTKAGLEGAQATLAMEAIFHGIRSAIIHPGFTDTPMVRSMGEDLISTKVIPNTQLKRLIRPDEIASAICFMIRNSSVSGVLWADAGWHPSA
jgi:NAD(P)-dependent dehydrogenase (short-subunit alcohol dehydrogenase family)